MCRESKRKTPAIVSLRNDERLFGDPAYTMVCVYVYVYLVYRIVQGVYWGQTEISTV